MTVCCLGDESLLGDISPSFGGSSSDLVSSLDACGVSVPEYGGMYPRANGVKGDSDPPFSSD